MQSVINLVEEKAKAYGLVKVTKIKLVVGKMTMAFPEALEMAFSALSRGTVAQSAKLEIEQREVRLRCPNCELEFVPELPYFACLRCGHVAYQFIQGRELYLEYFEGEGEG